jgi:hypothetical protein
LARRVVWQSARTREEFIFTGRLILVCNRPLDDIPELRAIKTRIAVVHYKATNAEVAALMRKIARRGHRHGPHALTAEECLEVADEIISQTQRLERNLDLRLLINTFNDRIQWAAGDTESHWTVLLEARMKERVVTPPAPVGVRAVRKQRELDLVRHIADLPPRERLDAWRRETGKSQAALYRRLEENSHFSQASQREVKNENGVVERSVAWRRSNGFN